MDGTKFRSENRGKDIYPGDGLVHLVFMESGSQGWIVNLEDSTTTLDGVNLGNRQKLIFQPIFDHFLIFIKLNQQSYSLVNTEKNSYDLKHALKTTPVTHASLTKLIAKVFRR